MRLNGAHAQQSRISETMVPQKPEVKAGVEQMLFILQKLESDARHDFLAADFRQLHPASDVNERLQHKEQQQCQQSCNS